MDVEVRSQLERPAHVARAPEPLDEPAQQGVDKLVAAVTAHRRRQLGRAVAGGRLDQPQPVAVTQRRVPASGRGADDVAQPARRPSSAATVASSNA